MGDGGVIFMLKMYIEDQGFITGLMEMKNSSIPEEAEKVLDAMAVAVMEKMKNEAPEFTGFLKESIAITRSTYQRRIQPHPRSLSGQFGRNYAYYVEGGTGPAVGNSSYTPNVENIALYYGASKSLAWAIAYAIKRKGTPANPFVARTFEWIQAMKDRFAGELANNIVIRMGKARGGSFRGGGGKKYRESYVYG